METMRDLLFVLTLCVTSSSTWAQGDIRMPPTIIVSPTSQVTYRQEERIPLECLATGAGVLTYEWIKNKAPLNLNDIRLEVREGGHTVIIKKAALLDEGFYQCTVSSAYGKAMSNTSHLQLATVSEASSKEINTISVVEGQPFEIRALPHKSFPKPTYSWEQAVNTEDTFPKKIITNKRIQMDDEGNLHFAYATKDDQLGGNIYKLITFNQYLDQKFGGSYTKVNIEAAQNVKDFAPISRFPQQLAYVGVVGRNISLRCFFGARPEAEYNWRTPDGSKRFHEFQNDKIELLIRDIKPEDQGDYICTGSNTMGRNDLKLQLAVEAAPEFKKQTDKLQNVNATVGETVTFRCYAEGSPKVTTVWYMNGNPIDNNNIPRRMRFSDNNRNLIIENVCRDCDQQSQDRATDLMVIQCNASNIHGYALGTGYLNVLKKTEVKSMSDADNVEVKRDEAKTVTFKCSAESDPSTPVAIEWRKVDPEDQNNDYLVHPDNKVIFVNQDQITFVVEQNNTAKWLDIMGRYRCKASNGYSSDFKVMTLKVEDIPIESTLDSSYQHVACYDYASYGTSGIGDLWWIFLIIALLLLLLILLLCCCIYCQRNRGDSYPVDEKERMNGNDPEKEIDDLGFHDYQRPEGQPLRSSGGSLSSSTKLNSDDEGSLNEYGDVDPGKFTEDGSFVGVYTNTADRKRGRSES